MPAVLPGSVAAASPAFAQSEPTAGQLPSPDDVATRDSLTIAAGAGITPDYEGSDDYRFIPAAAIRGQYRGISFSTRGLYLYVDVIPRGGAGVDFDFGPIVGARINKRRHIEDDVVELLPRTKTAIELGAFAGIGISGVTNPYDRLAFRLDLLHDVADAHRSTIFSPNIEFSTPLSRTTYVGANIGAEFVGNKYADYYYSISPAESLGTGGLLRPLPPHLDALLGFVRGAWSPPAPTRRLSLQELAAGACVSAGYLSRVFRHHYGVGPVAAFELLRLGRAATLLVRSNLAVAAVARDCGFANPYHFSRRFHRVYGQPPGRYRR